MIRRLSFAVLAVAWFVPLEARAQAARSANADSALRRRLDSLVALKLEWLPTPGLSVAVIRGRDTLLLRGYGVADRETRRPAAPSTVYPVASITKQVTAAAIMRLADQGKLRLDDDLGRYVPQFPLKGHRVTLRHLLNHTSGIPNVTAGQKWKRHWAEEVTPATIVGWVAQDAFDFAPGTRLAYSNTNYILLGMVIERVSGQSYAAFLEQELFRPLELRQTRFCESRSQDPTRAKGYSVRDSQFIAAQYISMTIPFAAGGICSSVSDFATWTFALHQGRVLSPASYRLLTAPARLDDGSAADYGFGLWLGRIGNRRAFMHGGGINGFSTAQVAVPQDSLAVVLFANSDAFTVAGIALDLARLALGRPPTGIGKLDWP